MNPYTAHIAACKRVSIHAEPYIERLWHKLILLSAIRLPLDYAKAERFQLLIFDKSRSQIDPFAVWLT